MYLKNLYGKQKQIPPIYSAIKVDGKKLYEYARSGKDVKIKPREIEIYNIYLNEYKKEEAEIIYTVECSKGTYIRTLCQDIAQNLNTVGCMKDLERIRVGKFDISNAIKIEELKQNKDNRDFLNKYFYTFEKILEDKGNIILKPDEIDQFLNGVKLKRNLKNGVYKIINNENIFIGTGEIKNGILKRDIII